MSEDLSKAVARVLKEYSESVTDSVQRVTNELAKEGVRRIKSESPASPNSMYSGSYRSGWTKKVITNRMGASAIIYNGKYPGLVHLLEKGHALRQGGRTRAQPHVGPVQDWLNEELPRRFEEAISK